MNFRAQLDRNHDEVRNVNIRLPQWSPPTTPVTQSSGANAIATTSAAPPISGSEVAVDVREGIHRFFRLSPSQKSELIGRLNLASDEDREFPDFERYKRALARAKHAKRWSEVLELLKELEEAL